MAFSQSHHRGHRSAYSPGCIQFSFQGHSRRTSAAEHSRACCLPRAGDFFLSYIHLLTEEPVTLGIDCCLARVDLVTLSQEGSQSHTPSGLLSCPDPVPVSVALSYFRSQISPVVPAKWARTEILTAALVLLAGVYFHLHSTLQLLNIIFMLDHESQMFLLLKQQFKRAAWSTMPHKNWACHRGEGKTL